MSKHFSYNDRYEQQDHPYYASARLWDDGVTDPAETRMVLGLCLLSSCNPAARENPVEETAFGVFRM